MTSSPRGRTRAARSLTALGAAAVLTATGAGAALAATASTGSTKVVTYRGHHFTVPADWPVIDLSADPTACVRFDRNAVYLGAPSDRQVCPSHLVGTTEALLVEPVTSPASAQSTVDQAVDNRFLATGSDVRVTGTYDKNKALIRAALAGSGLPAESRAVTPQAKSAAPAAAAPMTATAQNSMAPSGSTNYLGQGFDACYAPSSTAMADWKANSPYGAVGIYIGGPKRACVSTNLTNSWVQQQASAGWKFMPIYVGLQAGDIASPASQGTAAADDAANQAVSLGFGPGSLLYEDMEGGSAYNSSTKGNALAYLSAWTQELHARGYRSGVYSSSDAAIKDLAGPGGQGLTLPDALWFARWDGVAGTTDPNIPAGSFANHQRAKQYNGGTTRQYGSTTINVDESQLDISLPTVPQLSWLLSDSTTSSLSNHPTFTFGYSGMVPITGDWDGDGVVTAGAYDPNLGAFYLTNSLGGADSQTIRFGDAGWRPVVGRWDGGKKTELGVYNPNNATFYLLRADGSTTALSFGDYGNSWLPIAGDWTSNGFETPGLFNQSTATYYLLTGFHSGFADIGMPMGNPGDRPLTGRWDGDGHTELGVYRPSNATFFVLHTAGTVTAPVTSSTGVAYGDPYMLPVTGDWTGKGTDGIGIVKAG